MYINQSSDNIIQSFESIIVILFSLFVWNKILSEMELFTKGLVCLK